MPVDRSVWVVVRRGLREDVNTYHKALEHAASAGKRGAKASRRESLDPKITLSVDRADNVQLNRAFTAENVAQMIINRGRSGTESLRKGDLLPSISLDQYLSNLNRQIWLEAVSVGSGAATLQKLAVFPAK